MKNSLRFILYLLTGLIFILILLLAAFYPVRATDRYPAGGDDGKDIDTSRLAVVEFTVCGMDSVTINYIQDALDTTAGVNFNFACWNDTIVFIEYDSILTNTPTLMGTLEKLGYPAKVRSEY